MQQQLILFDINETVLDLAQLKPKFEKHLGSPLLLNTWFSALLHSSTVCITTGVKTNFKDLAMVSLNALAAKVGLNITLEQMNDIISTLGSLQAHEDIKPALIELRKANFQLFAFSNSSESLLGSQLNNAGLTKYFDGAISVESANTFKPSSEAYQFAIKALNTSANNVTLVAAHDWDTHGALCAGLKAAFVDRFDVPYNPVYKKPAIEAKTMIELAAKLIELNKQ